MRRLRLRTESARNPTETIFQVLRRKANLLAEGSVMPEHVRRARKSVENFSLDCDIYVTMIIVEMEKIIHAIRV